ncbi:uncharacterized protein LOC119685426 [Teleopsis dalmanni]|uniref:uncharacterized protein LOC119685426 n=1 Tax=Teleopsis dalmanni TaxID=139649 RepID=UPI0018CC7D1A|nr:uncharacterized protein LOC119685426 [Teleopsis dalmanni]
MPRRKEKKRAKKNVPVLKPYKSDTEIYEGMFIKASPSGLADIINARVITWGRNEGQRMSEVIIFIIVAVVWYGYHFFPIISMKHTEQQFYTIVYTAFYFLMFSFVTLKRPSFPGYGTFPLMLKMLTFLMQLCWIGFTVHLSTTYTWHTILVILNYICRWFAYTVVLLLSLFKWGSKDLVVSIQRSSFHVASYLILAIFCVTLVLPTRNIWKYVRREFDLMVYGVTKEKVFLSESDITLEDRMTRELNDDETPTHFLLAKDNALMKKLRRENRRANRARANR